MKYVKIICALTAWIFAVSAHAQRIDTLVDVGGYKLHFTILKGTGTPILFEAGMGNDGSVWDSIIYPVHKTTGTTVIAYDRAGYGKSGFDLQNTDGKHNVLHGIMGLETGLEKLGYNGKMMLVCHSFGGFYTTLYAARHPENVKYVVRLDASLATAYNDDFLKAFAQEKVDKSRGLGWYYERLNFPTSVNIMRQVRFPDQIPVVNVVAGIPDASAPDADARTKNWWNCQQKFVNEQPNRQMIKALGSRHDLQHDNPELITSIVVKAYVETLDKPAGCDMLHKVLDNSVEMANEARQREVAYLSSEDNLNDLGYTFLAKDQVEKATEIFRLNTILFPDSWNVWDSYAEALATSNNKKEAIKMYQKSLKLNPGNENAKAMLEKLK